MQHPSRSPAMKLIFRFRNVAAFNARTLQTRRLFPECRKPSHHQARWTPDCSRKTLRMDYFTWKSIAAAPACRAIRAGAETWALPNGGFFSGGRVYTHGLQ